MARPRLITSDLKRVALELAALGLSRQKIAEGLGVSRVTLRRELARDPSFEQQLSTVAQASSPDRPQGSNRVLLLKLFAAELQAAINRRQAS